MARLYAERDGDDIVHLQPLRGLGRKRVHVRAVTNRHSPQARSSHRMLEKLILAELQRLPMEPHHHRMKITRNVRRVMRRNQHFSAAQVNFIGKPQRHGHGMCGFRDFAIVGDDGMYARRLTRGEARRPDRQDESRHWQLARQIRETQNPAVLRTESEIARHPPPQQDAPEQFQDVRAASAPGTRAFACWQ
jgi:hypothetical protein